MDSSDDASKSAQQSQFAKLRRTEPKVVPCGRGTERNLIEIERDAELFEEAWQEFQSDKVAASNDATSATSQSRKGWWNKPGPLSFVAPAN